MSYLSEELQRQLDSAKASIDGVSDKTKIARSQIYKWLNGEQISISAGQLDALAEAFNATPTDHAKLLVAHLQDERFGKSAPLVRIEIDTPAELRDRPKPRTKGERAMAFLAEERVKFKDVNDLIIDLAKVLGAEL